MNILTPQQWGVFHSYQHFMPQDNTPPDFHTTNDLDTFFGLLTGWHKNKVDTLNHMKDVPEGTEVSMEGDDSPPIILSGDMLAGFQLGIELSLMELGTLPFEAMPDDEPAASDEPVAA